MFGLFAYAFFVWLGLKLIDQFDPPPQKTIRIIFLVLCIVFLVWKTWRVWCQ